MNDTMSKGCMAAVLAAVLLLCFAAAQAQEDEDADGMVTCSADRLSVDASSVRAEDLMKELGDRCGIKVVVHGEVFSELPVSLKFKDMAVRKGIERVLRVCDVANYMIHFRDGDNGSRIVGLDLVGKKGGERHLTSGVPATVPPDDDHGAADAARRQVKHDRADTAGEDAADEMDAKIQENFLKIMDEVLKTQLEDGVEPDPAEVLRLFKEVVPPEMKDQIPPEVMEELEKLER